MSKKREDTPSAFRAFPFLTPSGITDVPDRKIRHRIRVNPESYARHRGELCKYEISSLMTYRAILKSNLSAWQAWSSTLTVFKFTMVGAVCGAIIPMSLSWLFGHLKHGGPFIVDIAVFPAGFIMLWLMRSPARVIIKIERATFMLEILEEIIRDRQQVSAVREIAATESRHHRTSINNLGTNKNWDSRALTDHYLTETEPKGGVKNGIV